MLAFSNDYYGMIFRATQSVELFCAYDTSINPGFVDIKSTAIKTDSDWSSSKIESTLEEISLRATVMRHSLMP